MSNDPLAFRRHELPSGMRVFYQHRPLPFTGCRAIIHAGSRRDPPGKRELMHLLEHLVGADMRGIPSRSLTELERWIAKERMEAMLGMTLLDYTAYDAQAANERLENAMRFLRTLTLDPTLESQLDKERDIIRREREESATPKKRKKDRTRALAIFGDDPVGGAGLWAEDAELDQLTTDDCRAAHTRWYHPANMSLIIVGGIDEDEALRTAEKLFVPDSRPFVPADPLPLRTFAPPQQKRAYRQPQEGETELSELTVYWHMPLVRVQVLNLATDALEERLNERIREKQRASYGVDIEIESHCDHRVCAVTTNVQPGHEQRTRRVIMEEVRRLAEYDDLDRHRDEAMLSYGFIEPDIDDTYERVTSSIVISGAPRSVADIVAELKEVTTEDIRAFARDHLAPERAYVEIVEE